eukprot:Em0052g17a
MLGGLGWNDLQEQDGDEENENEHNIEKEKPQRKRKQNTSAAQYIEKNPVALNISSSDSDFEVDPLYRHPFAAFDEGGVENLLLNQLCVKDDFCALLLDATSILRGGDLLHEYQNMKTQEVKGTLLQANFQCLEICDSFATFCFDADITRESKDFCNSNTCIYDEQWCKDAMKDSSIALSAEYSMLQHHVMSESNFQEDPEVHCPTAFEAIEEADVQEADETVAVCGDMKMVEVLHSNPGLIPNFCDKEGDLRLSEALAPSEYSYLNPSVLSTWAGPLHWKIKTGTKDSKNVERDQNSNKPGTRQLVQQQWINFGLVLDDNLLCKGKASFQLKAFTEDAVRLNTLPRDDHAALDVVFKLFMRPGWQVTRHGNVPSQFTSMKDEAEDMELQDDLDSDLHNDLDSVTQSEIDEFAPMQQQEDSLGGFENLLVEVPKKVEQVHIEYAHSAKQVDVKRLKKEMWNILESYPADTTLNVLCQKLPQVVPITSANNLSIPICFVCLLHLANEKGLKLYSNELMNDCCIQLSSI